MGSATYSDDNLVLSTRLIMRIGHRTIFDYVANWPVYIINPVDKIKLSSPHLCRTTVSELTSFVLR